MSTKWEERFAVGQVFIHDAVANIHSTTLKMLQFERFSIAKTSPFSSTIIEKKKEKRGEEEEEEEEKIEVEWRRCVTAPERVLRWEG